MSHIGKDAKATMVDVSSKQVTLRSAEVTSAVQVSEGYAQQWSEAITREICTTARIAGISAAKKTWELIPLCHQINLTRVDVEIDLVDGTFVIKTHALAHGVTGVEMEAMTAAQVAALTIYDMIKAVDPMATLGPTLLMRKSGGRSEISRSAAKRPNSARKISVSKNGKSRNTARADDSSKKSSARKPSPVRGRSR